MASEVRALAQRSAEAAKEIKSLISTSSNEVAQGVKLVGQTGTALDSIADKVSEMDTLVAEIASSAQEQASGLSQVNIAVNQMDQVTQQNAAMVEETTAAAANLKSEAEGLARMVGRFQTGHVADVDDGRQRSAPVGPPPALVRQRAKLRAVAGGGQTEAWTEF